MLRALVIVTAISLVAGVVAPEDEYILRLDEFEFTYADDPQGDEPLKEVLLNSAEVVVRTGEEFSSKSTVSPVDGDGAEAFEMSGKLEITRTGILRLSPVGFGHTSPRGTMRGATQLSLRAGETTPTGGLSLRNGDGPWVMTMFFLSADRRIDDQTQRQRQMEQIEARRKAHVRQYIRAHREQKRRYVAWCVINEKANAALMKSGEETLAGGDTAVGNRLLELADAKPDRTAAAKEDDQQRRAETAADEKAAQLALELARSILGTEDPAVGKRVLEKIGKSHSALLSTKAGREATKLLEELGKPHVE